jgi:uncharacterized protein YdeI (YjbR/CyaY-like superfamily)
MKAETKKEVVVPKELKAALAKEPAARAAFEKLPPSHRRQYADYIAEAKQAETRERRAQKAVEMLRMIRPA